MTDRPLLKIEKLNPDLFKFVVELREVKVTVAPLILSNNVMYVMRIKWTTLKRFYCTSLFSSPPQTSAEMRLAVAIGNNSPIL